MLLLADVFETFWDTCLKHNKLNPAHFYTSPELAWKAALKHTGLKLELLTDIDMLLMVEKGIREGITQAVPRYAKANNKYMDDQYNPKEASKILQYLTQKISMAGQWYKSSRHTLKNQLQREY